MAQPLRELYEETVSLGDTVLQKKVLDGWEAMRPTDADLCQIRAEQYFRKSQRKKAVADSLPFVPRRAIMHVDTSRRAKPTYSQIKFEYNREDFEEAIRYLSKGIEANPDHIVLRTLKIGMLQELDDPRMSQEVLDLVKHAKTNGNSWLMHDSVPWDSYDTLSLFLQRKVRHMFARRNVPMPILREIATDILALYPDHHQSIVDIGRTYYLEQEYDEALKYFYKAEKVLPHSLETLGYIALCSYYTFDRITAIKYFDKLKEFGDEDDRQFADDRIEELSR